MNKIDFEFQKILKEIDDLTLDELQEKILKKYLTIPDQTKDSIEDFFSKFPYWGVLNRRINNYEEIKLKATSLKNTSIWKEMYASLEDYRSKTILYAILNNWFTYDFKTLKSVMENTFLHYCDLDINPTCHKEVLVDLGAYIGDSILDFTSVYNESSFDKIYAYEMSLNSVEKLKENTKNMPNIIIRNVGVEDKQGLGKIIENKESTSANVLESSKDGNLVITTLDEDIKEKITMIKMDIEGCEYKALLGSKNHIINDKPKLMISIYHSFEDVYRIWEFLKTIKPDYKFFLRYYGGPIFPTEIVLYAI